MPVSQYIPHLIYSTALTSLSFHLLYHRKQTEVDRGHLTAQISILESLKQQLQSGQHVPEEEIERLLRLSKTHEESNLNLKKEKIGWKAVFLGRKLEADGGVRETKAFEEGKFKLNRTPLTYLTFISSPERG